MLWESVHQLPFLHNHRYSDCFNRYRIPANKLLSIQYVENWWFNVVCMWIFLCRLTYLFHVNSDICFLSLFFLISNNIKFSTLLRGFFSSLKILKGENTKKKCWNQKKPLNVVFIFVFLFLDFCFNDSSAGADQKFNRGWLIAFDVLNVWQIAVATFYGLSLTAYSMDDCLLLKFSSTYFFLFFSNFCFCFFFSSFNCICLF